MSDVRRKKLLETKKKRIKNEQTLKFDPEHGYIPGIVVVVVVVVVVTVVGGVVVFFFLFSN